MKVDITSMFFNSSIEGQTATPAWRTSLGQSKTKECRIETDIPGIIDIVVGMTYKIVSDISKLNMSGISGNLLMCSTFDKIYVNNVLLPNVFYTLLLLKETSQSHEGRMQLCYSPHIVYDGKSNSEAINQIRDAIGCTPNGCWFVYDISIKNQDELHFSTKVVDPENPKIYNGKSQQRSKEWKDLIESSIFTIDELAGILKDLYEEGKNAGEGVASIYFYGLKYADNILTNNYRTKEIIEKSGIGASFQTELDKAIKLYSLLQRKGWSSIKPRVNISTSLVEDSTYYPYLTALRTKPFMLLAGISGTGKSRIARQIAKACWKQGDAEYGNNNPSNFCLVQVKPNWHDSTELLGYVSRINKEPKYVTGDFLPFIAKAWENKDVPHIFCLDEMNLAPVEQYFAEYLSVVESRKLDNGTIITDPIIKKNKEDWYRLLTAELTDDDELRAQFLDKGITLPPNLFVIGTVNMDETTFSFSRKVLDRAMTIEMNEVDLEGGLAKEEQNELGEIGNSIIGLAVEGKDVYEDHKDYCDQVIDYLKLVNEELENTPFKIAYRTRNEFLLYAVNRKAFDNESTLETALDEMTSMKILPRIEGDSERVKNPLEALRKLMQERNWNEETSISLKKIKEMLTKLQQSGYTSYWT